MKSEIKFIIQVARFLPNKLGDIHRIKLIKSISLLFYNKVKNSREKMAQNSNFIVSMKIDYKHC